MSTEKNTSTSNPRHSRPRIAIAYSGAHPAHIKMLADIDAASIMMLGEWSVGRNISTKRKLFQYLNTALKLRNTSSEIVIIEGTVPSTLMAPIINCCSLKPKTIIALSAEDGLYRAFVARKRLDHILTKVGFHYISGIVASGDLVAKLANQYLGPMPVAIRYPQLAQETWRSLLLIEPSLDSHNMLLIGSGSALCKGVDIASQSRALLKDEFPDVQLTTVGRLDFVEQPGVNPQGPVDNIKPHLASSSILIHPGRGEAFGIAIIESMLAGVVPFISEWTGTASLVEKVDPRLIVPLQANEFAVRIAEFWRMDSSERWRISDKCREIAREFAEQSLSQKSLKDFMLSLRNSS